MNLSCRFSLGLRKKVKINVIGHSLGGSLPRFALRFWPDTRLKVKNLISFGATNHGTILVNIICQLLPCPIGIIQQRQNSTFLCALNSYQETFSSVRYRNILSKFDELVQPAHSGEIEGKSVKNIYIQDLCPRRIYVGHLALGIYDYCAFRLT